MYINKSAYKSSLKYLQFRNIQKNKVTYRNRKEKEEKTYQLQIWQFLSISKRYLKAEFLKPPKGGVLPETAGEPVPVLCGRELKSRLPSS